MQICEIDYTLSTAVENMALDAAMLDLTGDRNQALWRLYGWNEPAVTFGYSQHWSWIRSEMNGFGGACIRRLTGGGIVDHRNDLTYALTIPSSHAFFRDPALDVYKRLHQHIAEILVDLGIQAELAPCGKGCGVNGEAAIAGICFQQPEPYDVVAGLSGAKIAGAAMKRNKSGILIQGSLDRHHLPGLSTQVFGRKFGRALACWLDAESLLFKGKLPVESLSENRIRFASGEWNEKR